MYKLEGEDKGRSDLRGLIKLDLHEDSGGTCLEIGFSTDFFAYSFLKRPKTYTATYRRCTLNLMEKMPKSRLSWIRNRHEDTEVTSYAYLEHVNKSKEKKLVVLDPDTGKLNHCPKLQKVLRESYLYRYPSRRSSICGGLIAIEHYGGDCFIVEMSTGHVLLELNSLIPALKPPSSDDLEEDEELQHSVHLHLEHTRIVRVVEYLDQQEGGSTRFPYLLEAWNFSGEKVLCVRDVCEQSSRAILHGGHTYVPGANNLCSHKCRRQLVYGSDSRYFVVAEIHSRDTEFEEQMKVGLLVADFNKGTVSRQNIWLRNYSMYNDDWGDTFEALVLHNSVLLLCERMLGPKACKSLQNNKWFQDYGFPDNFLGTISVFDLSNIKDEPERIIQDVALKGQRPILLRGGLDGFLGYPPQCPSEYGWTLKRNRGIIVHRFLK